MDADVFIAQINECFSRVVADKGLLMELSEKFTFLVEGAKWHPKVKRGLWDGKIRMLDMRNGHIKKGLIPEVIKWCEDNKLTYALEDEFFSGKNISLERNDVIKLYKKLDAPYVPKDYQIDGIMHAINNKRSIILSPTGSGKSYMLYGLARFYNLLGLKVLIAVHRSNLVKQLIQENFCEEYDKFRNSFTSHMIYAGQKKTNSADITASTWQSIVDLPEKFFSGFDVIICDEVHAWKATSTIKIMEKCKNIVYRTGVTGTLDDIQSNVMSLTGDFGPPERVAHTHELIDSGDLADLKIKATLLDYDEKYRKFVANKCKKYADEISFLETLNKRTDMICKLADSLKGNVLIAFRHKKHGQEIVEKLKTQDKFFIDGSIDVDERIKMQKAMDQHNNMKGVVSIGTFAEGVNIKNVNYVILACPMKKQVKLLQLIGRALRVSGKKDSAVFIDIGDDLSYKKKNNYSLIHYIERIKRYNAEKFNVEYIKIPIN